jgi:hypothetical protein
MPEGVTGAVTLAGDVADEHLSWPQRMPCGQYVGARVIHLRRCLTRSLTTAMAEP